ncbi:hypothetical protein [Pampinifervens florentissimum]|uniref:hypothetical protein n=1 Tax=Pampinifervens florentissimum TaxID=1632019 RepID=UPI0013B47FDB|nr:hypothetical protein [Hydrogenobacter sp. T-8]QID33352.1 hypothetical protein G3M65_06060 [Hydrogenobacter sp. T-8]
MSENLLKIELYRILVSVAVGLITILVFIFNVSVAERYYYNQTQRSDAEKKVIRQSMDSIESKNQVSINNLRFTWKDLKWAVKRTLRIFNENVIAFLVVSVFVGEFFSWIGLISTLGLFEKNLDAGLHNRELYVDNDIKWRHFIALVRPMVNEKTKFTLGISEVHFALAKGFSGLSISIYVCSTMLIIFSIIYIVRNFSIVASYSNLPKIISSLSAITYFLMYFFLLFIYIIVYTILLLNLVIKKCVFLNSLISSLRNMPERFILISSAFFILVISINFLLIDVSDKQDYSYFLFFIQVFAVILSFLLSIYHLRTANQFMCLASEECYKKQDTIQDTTSQPSTNQSPPQSPPQHTQER